MSAAIFSEQWWPGCEDLFFLGGGGGGACHYFTPDTPPLPPGVLNQGCESSNFNLISEFFSHLDALTLLLNSLIIHYCVYSGELVYNLMK